MHQAPQPPHGGRRPGLWNPAAGSASAQARPGPQRPPLARHTGRAPSARVKSEARAFLTADRDAHAGRQRRGRACMRGETDGRGRARARAEAIGKGVHARGGPAQGPWSSLALLQGGPRPCRLRDQLRRPGQRLERRGRAGAEDLRGPGLRLRFSYTFSRVKDEGSVPSPPVFAREISSEATAAVWHRASAAMAAPRRGEGPTAPAVSNCS